MMPDLGKYADSVLGAYGVSLLLLAALVWLSWSRARKLRDELNDVERRAAQARGASENGAEGIDVNG